MSIFPSKLTSSQRTKVKLAKLNQSATKTGIKEAGSTIRSVVSSLAANRTIQNKIGADSVANQRKVNEKSINDALNIYNSIMGGNPSGEGSEGSKQKESTTEVGGSGSKLGG